MVQYWSTISPIIKLHFSILCTDTELFLYIWKSSKIYNISNKVKRFRRKKSGFFCFCELIWSVWQISIRFHLEAGLDFHKSECLLTFFSKTVKTFYAKRKQIENGFMTMICNHCAWFSKIFIISGLVEDNLEFLRSCT